MVLMGVSMHFTHSMLSHLRPHAFIYVKKDFSLMRTRVSYTVLPIPPGLTGMVARPLLDDETKQYSLPILC